MKRTPSSGLGSSMKESAFQSEPRVSESLVRHTSASPADKAKVTISDGKAADEEKPKKSSLCRTVEGCREELQNQVGLWRRLVQWAQGRAWQVGSRTSIVQGSPCRSTPGTWGCFLDSVTHFHNGNMNCMCCQSLPHGEGFMTKEYYGGFVGG